MITTSQAWKDYSRDVGVFHIKATLDNGTQMTLTDEDFMLGSVSITDSISGMSKFTVGAVITNSFNATLNNFSGKFNNYNLAGARLSVQFGIIYEDESEEWIDRGTYTLEKPTSLGSTIKVVGYDNMDKLNKFYAGKKLSGSNKFTQTGATYDYWKDINGNNVSKSGGFYSAYMSVDGSTEYETNAPADSYVVFYDQYFYRLSAEMPINGVVKSHTSARYAIISGYVNEIPYYYFRAFHGSTETGMSERLTAPYFAMALCDYCGVEYDSDFWGLDDYLVLPGIFERNESTTYREVLSLLVQISGGYARMNPVGKLEVKAFNRNEWSDGVAMSGGTINPWASINPYDGGAFDPWAAVTDYDGGTDGDIDFTLSKIKSLNVYIDDITITGVRVYRYNTVYEQTYEQYGTDGYVISIQDNPMVSGNENNPTTASSIATRVGSLLNGIKFRPFDASIIGDPSFEAGDVVALYDYLGNIHVSLITSLTYSVNQIERLECSAEYPVQNIQDFSNPQTQTIQQAISATKNDVFANGINVNDQVKINPDGTLTASGNATIGGNETVSGNLSVGGSLTINSQPLADYVVEEGTSGAWTYRKWDSGIAECWSNNYSLGSCAITSSYGNAFYIAKTDYSFPTDLFISAPQVNVSTLSSLGLLSASVYEVTASKYSFFLWDTQSETLTVSISVRAIGEWK